MSLLVCCEYVRVCQERGSPCNILVGSARESFRMVVAEGSCVGIQLGNIRVRKELPVGAPEDAPCMGCDVYVGYILYGLFSARGGGA